MPIGLPGFVGCRHFALFEHRPGTRFRWLQSCDRPELAFVVIDPLLHYADYPLEMVRRASAFSGIDPDEPLHMLVLCTIDPPPAEPKANFLAPIGYGERSRQGAQVVLHDARYKADELLR